MSLPPRRTDPGSSALFTDLYQLTMAQAYVEEGLDGGAVFSLFCRNLPPHRNYLLACGLEPALEYLEELSFREEELEFLAGRDEFEAEFIDYLEAFSFTGDVHAVPEGTPVFPEEPLLEVEAPIPEAQLAETLLLNQLHFSTVLASKAVRVVDAAGDRASVVDFGMRRMHGTDAAMKAARAFHIAGVTATSNVRAGQVYDVPITGTMAHSYIEAHDDEFAAFRAFAEQYPETILLVDTYDTLDGVRHVLDLAEELGEAFRVRGIRLDSGDLGALARKARAMLDETGLKKVDIFASGGLDEFEIRRLLEEEEAPIDGFGVGTRMGVSEDAPSLDSAYKLVAYDGRGRMKLSTGKMTLPGRKQIWRKEENGIARGDVIGLASEDREGRPLLEPVMRKGRRVDTHRRTLEESRSLAREARARLPERLRKLEETGEPYPVTVSDPLRKERDRVRRRMEEQVAPVGARSE